MHIPKNDKLEQKGRLLLWHSAVSECRTLLDLAIRADEAFRDEKRHSQFNDRCKAANEFAKQQPDFEAGIQKYSHHAEFNRKNPEPFPSITECHSIAKYPIMLAVVLFCQIFNNGYHAEGAVAKNDRNFIRDNLEPILKLCFPENTQKEIEKFDNFCSILKELRDCMFGHADGSAFDFEYAEHVIKHKGYMSDLDKIDLIYWVQILEPLRLAIFDYSRNS